MRCGDCKHFKPARNPETNRPLPSQEGNCTYPVEWPKLPKSFLPDRWACRASLRHVQFPERRLMWGVNEEQCACFEARPAKTKEAAQMALTTPND